MKTTRWILIVALFASVARAAQSEFAEPFKAAWGDKVKAALATRDTADDLNLAKEMLAAARGKDQPPGLAGYACEQAFALASKDPAGLSTAIDAMGLRGGLLPETRADCADKALALGQKQFIAARANDKPAAGDRLIDILLAQSELWCQSGDYDKATVSLKRAGFTAAGIKSERAAAINAEAQLVAHRQKSAVALAPLLGKLKANPQDKPAALAAMKLYTIDFDNPAKAAEFSAAAGDAAWQQNLQLVATAEKDSKKLSDTQYRALAEWYRGHAAAPAVAGSMLRRSYNYYMQFIIRHPPDDPERQKAEMAATGLEEQMRKLNVEIPDSPLAAAGDNKPRRRPSFFGIEIK